MIPPLPKPNFSDPTIVAVYEVLMRADPFERTKQYGSSPIYVAYETDACTIVEAEPRNVEEAIAALADIGQGHYIHRYKDAFRQLWPAIEKALR